MYYMYTNASEDILYPAKSHTSSSNYSIRLEGNSDFDFPACCAIRQAQPFLFPRFWKQSYGCFDNFLMVSKRAIRYDHTLHGQVLMKVQ